MPVAVHSITTNTPLLPVAVGFTHTYTHTLTQVRVRGSALLNYTPELLGVVLVELPVNVCEDQGGLIKIEN